MLGTGMTTWSILGKENLTCRYPSKAAKIRSPSLNAHCVLSISEDHAPARWRRVLLLLGLFEMNLKSEITNAIKYEEIGGVSRKDVVAVSLLGLQIKTR